MNIALPVMNWQRTAPWMQQLAHLLAADITLQPSRYFKSGQWLGMAMARISGPA
ncbi:hypothetical protein [Paracoccus seriniphilus]|uniref:hypothetical protein n=1 Tax=Paracoccus seriniphilus TaxID=184748 RepID=UPI0015C5875B|nr:hypothetical protein [Paracoccus seriniphilus]